MAAASAYVMIDRERERRYVDLEGHAGRIAELFSRSLADSLWNADPAARELATLARWVHPAAANPPTSGEWIT